MPGRLGPRFALEAVFLILLAVGAGLADLTTREIVLVMALGWLLVALFELATERLNAAAAPFRRGYYTAPPAVPAAPLDEPIEPQRRDVEEATVIVSPSAIEEAVVTAPGPAREAPPAEPVRIEPEPVHDPDPVPDPDPDPELAPSDEPEQGSQRYRLEPLEPPSKRRWFGRRERDPEQPSAERESDLEPEPIAQPKHVRLLPGRGERARVAEEVAEIFDTAEPDERRR